MKKNNYAVMNYLSAYITKFARLLKMCAMAFTKSCNKNNCFFFLFLVS